MSSRKQIRHFLALMIIAGAALLIPAVVWAAPPPIPTPPAKPTISISTPTPSPTPSPSPTAGVPTPIPAPGVLSVTFTAVTDHALIGAGGSYKADVTNTGVTSLSDVTTTPIGCPNFTYVSGDLNANNALDPGETWHYQCDITYAANDAGSLSVQIIVSAKTVSGEPVQKFAQALTIVSDPNASARPAAALPVSKGPTDDIPVPAVLLALLGTLLVLSVVALERPAAVELIGKLREEWNYLRDRWSRRFGRRRTKRKATKGFMTSDRLANEGRKNQGPPNLP